MIESPSDFRWQYLPNFPRKILNKATEYFWSNYPTEKDIDSASMPIGEGFSGKMFSRKVWTDFNHPILHNTVLFLVSNPNSGVQSVHTDKSRNFSINFPIQVDPVKGPFLCGYHREYKSYVWEETVIVDGLETNRFSYREKDFEKVAVDQPLIVNTKIPHSWANDSDKHRIIGSFFLKVKELDKAIAIAKDWM
jgi:hypothetical protein